MEIEASAELSSAQEIKKCPECGLELVGPNAVCACDNSLSISQGPIKDPFIGTILGNTYEVLELVGRGGMGVVYKARDILMDRIVAIKMLHAHLVADSQSIQRFQQEARAASAINHQNVITAYDFGVANSRQPYLIMDFLEGKSLSAVIDENNGLDDDRSIHIFAQICDALVAAHARGVLHRDLKPSNIMIVKNRDDPDFVKIVDFGIAKLMPGSGKQSQNLTQTGELFGSPLYMSPEQFLGKSVDLRTDIYAMGCVMYETLIGHPPFSGEHVLETMHKHLKESAQKFSEARPDKKISTRIETIVMRALEKDPDQRFQSMAELRDEVLLARSGAKDERNFNSRLQSLRSRIKRFYKRNQSMVKKMGVAAAAVLLIGITAGTWAFLSQGDKDTQWQTLRREGQESYRRGDLQAAKKKFYDAAKIALQAYGEENHKYLDTLERLAWVYEELEDYGLARKIIGKIKNLQPVDMMGLKGAQMLAYGTSSQLNNLRDNNVLEGPEKAYKASIKNLEKYLGPTDPGLIPLYQGLAETYEKLQRFAEAEDARIKLVSIREDSQGPESVGVAEARVGLADLYVLWGKSVSAKKQYEEAQRTYTEAKDSYQTSVKLFKDLLGANAKQLVPLEEKLRNCESLEAEAAKLAKENPATPNGELPAYEP